MDKHKENGISIIPCEVIKYDTGVETLKKEVELYNDIYKEISEIVGLDAILSQDYGVVIVVPMAEAPIEILNEI